MDLVLQGEVEGEVLSGFVVVNLHSGSVLVGLKVLDDIWEPHREPVEPGHSNIWVAQDGRMDQLIPINLEFINMSDNESQ